MKIAIILALVLVGGAYVLAQGLARKVNHMLDRWP
jgi:hypothetical protein